MKSQLNTDIESLSKSSSSPPRIRDTRTGPTGSVDDGANHPVALRNVHASRRFDLALERGQNGFSNVGRNRNVVGSALVDLISRPPECVASRSIQICILALFNVSPKPRQLWPTCGRQGWSSLLTLRANAK